MKTSSEMKELLSTVADTLGINPASGDATMFAQWLLGRPGFNVERAGDAKWLGAKFKQWRRSRRGKRGAMIRLASTLPVGSSERRALLTALKGANS